jgi:hypothetical protein
MEFIIGLIIFGFIFYWIFYGMIWVIAAIVFYPQLLLIPIGIFLLMYILNKLIDPKTKS